MSHASTRSEEITSFIVMDILERAHELEAEGRSIIHLEIGEPDFDTPDVIKDAAKMALDQGKTGYTHSLGLAELRSAVAEHYNSTYKVEVDPEQVIVTSGTSPALLLIFSALLEPGDQVIMTDPCYACYPNYVKFLGGEPALIKVNDKDGFAPSKTAVDAAINDRTEAFIINSPGNPTGHTIPAAILESYAYIAAANDITIISDEIYHGMTYGESAHSILEYSPDAFVINGFSKRFAMPGWRLGYIIAPPRFVRNIQKLQQNFFLCANSFVQWAALSALKSPEVATQTKSMVETYRGRLAYLLPELRAMGFDIKTEPDGAFYILAGARAFSDDSLAFAYELLENAGVAVTPGIDFGPGGEGYIRFSYATSMENLVEGVRRLRNYLSSRG